MLRQRVEQALDQAADQGQRFSDRSGTEIAAWLQATRPDLANEDPEQVRRYVVNWRLGQ